MFQDANLMPGAPFIENIALPLEFDRIPKHERLDTARKCCRG